MQTGIRIAQLPPIIEDQKQFLLDRIDGTDGAEIPVEDLQGVVVLQLEAPIPRPIDPTASSGLGHPISCRVESLLQAGVQCSHTRLPAMHRREDLDLPDLELIV